MLAPRKTLHSTPIPVFEKALDIVGAREEDVLYDIGCGDGRLVVAAAELYGVKSIGVEIDRKRIEEGKTRAREANVEHLVEFRQENGLEVDLQDATIIFLFLIERGLRLMKPRLSAFKTPCRVITYLYAIPGLEYAEKHFVSTTKQINTQAGGGKEDVQFPIYIYHFPIHSSGDA